MAESAKRIAGPRRPAVFLDRDGVINVDRGYVASRADFKWIPGAIQAIKALNDAGYYVFVATNQSGIARGLYTEREMQELHDYISRKLAEKAARIDDWRYCPFHPEGTIAALARTSDWRKPEPGMILDLLRAWPVDRSRSVLIGDKESDMQAARAADVRGLRFDGGNLLAFVRAHVLGPRPRPS
ncbi:MAG TPA: HAD family hydrolase [Xanthobacteraceae bacterium]|nr:HAD family hydrolase [Xanthobacteraceae bacterium]